MTTFAEPRQDTWIRACALEWLLPNRGVAVLLPDARRRRCSGCPPGSPQSAVGNIDPIGRAAVMSRGIVGDRRSEPTVASPLLKQVYSLVDGRCLDDPAHRLPVYEVRVVKWIRRYRRPLSRWPDSPSGVTAARRRGTHRAAGTPWCDGRPRPGDPHRPAGRRRRIAQGDNATHRRSARRGGGHHR